ncbi:hypothetical protein B0H13DRAFT_2426216 [Mycena leptocephala]|nr:hypothetical protein B0H13DRAFT_2426216 [Mycena leptocephala]
MVCSTVLFLFIFVGAVLGAPPATGVLFNIKDFQGNVFDLAFTSSADLAPVQTLNVKPGVSAQAWTLSSVGTLFTIANPFVGTFLSFTMAKNGLNPTCAQICGYTGVATAWNISANAVGLGYNIIEPTSKLAVTSWPASNSTIIGHTTPLTLQPLDPNERQQVFSFPQFPE